MSKPNLFNQSSCSLIDNLHYQIDHSPPYSPSGKVPFNSKEDEVKSVENRYREAYKLIISDLIKNFREEK